MPWLDAVTYVRALPDGRTETLRCDLREAVVTRDGVEESRRPFTEPEIDWADLVAQRTALDVGRQRLRDLRQALRDFKNLPSPDHSAWTNQDRRNVWNAATDLCRVVLDLTALRLDEPEV